jgi:hypothetical protein
VTNALRAALLIAVSCAFLDACDGRQQQSADTTKVPPADSSRLAAQGAPLLIVLDELPAMARDTGLDSAAAERRITQLDQFAMVANGDSAAAALLRAGVLKLRHRRVAYDSAPPTRRPGEYHLDEIAGGWLYTGVDFDTLVAQYPRSDLVDDARFARLFVVSGGECEGRPDCYVALQCAAPIEFLRQHPASPYAPIVVAMINSVLRQHLGGIANLTQATDVYDPLPALAIVARFDTVSRALPPPARDSARSVIESLLQKAIPARE